MSSIFKISALTAYSLKLLIILIILTISFPSLVAAQVEPGYYDRCSFIHENLRQQHFTCTLDFNYNWTPDYTDIYCDNVNYAPDYTTCTGSVSNRKFIDSTGESHDVVCLPCKKVNTSEPVLEHGAACGAGIDGVCEPNTTCRNGKCLYPEQTQPFGTSCVDDSECVIDTTGEVLTCRENKCIYFEDRYCDTDTECQQKTGNSNAICSPTTETCTVPGGDPVTVPVTKAVGTPFDYCSQVPEGSQRQACLDCVGKGGPDVSGKIYTALGCIDVSYDGLATDLIRLLVGISGGIALLTILSAAFLLAISQGDSNKVKQAKEMITSAVVGLLFLIFSIFILEFIGVDILKIPGLSDGSTGGYNTKIPENISCGVNSSPDFCNRSMGVTSGYSCDPGIGHCVARAGSVH